MTDALHMLRLDLDGRKLIEMGRKRGLPLRDLDLGYLVHCALGELFGENAPRPFSATEGARGRVSVLGYCSSTAGELSDQARTFAQPDVFNLCDWDAVASKQMPSSWKVGMVLGFEARVCPIVRMSKPGPKHDRTPHAEVDAFIAACWKADALPEGQDRSVDREAVYKEWLKPRVEQGGAELIEASLSRFQREKLLRRNHEPNRKSHTVERPDATFSGTLRVTDADKFQKLLSGGLGRHKGFGFGMVLLKPARSGVSATG